MVIRGKIIVLADRCFVNAAALFVVGQFDKNRTAEGGCATQTDDPLPRCSSTTPDGPKGGPGPLQCLP